MTFNEIIEHIGVEPYYRDEQADIVIYCADCRDILPQISDKSIDLVLTDPPYGVVFEYENRYDSPSDFRDMMKFLIPQIVRISTMSILPCCRIVELPFIYQYYPPDWLICWYKGSTGHRAFVGFNDWEPHLVYGKNKGISFHDYFYCQPETSHNTHPCPKPEGWANYFIARACSPNNLILDPFLGSGTTAYCAKKLGRKCIGIEINPKYCEIAKKRLSQSVMKLDI